MNKDEVFKLIRNALGSKEDALQDRVNALLDANNELVKEIEKMLPAALETYYNTKYPQKNMFYLRHETDGDYKIDVRNFFQVNDAKIPTIKRSNGPLNQDDIVALDALKYVIEKIKYVKDSAKESYKTTEYWAYAYQTLMHQQGDCEDGAILLANILVKSGIPYWKVRISAGNVLLHGKKVGHSFVTYYCEEQDRWVVLDWCYWPNLLPLNQRKDYAQEENYLDVWFSFNEKYAFSTGTRTTIQ